MYQAAYVPTALDCWYSAVALCQTDFSDTRIHLSYNQVIVGIGLAVEFLAMSKELQLARHLINYPLGSQYAEHSGAARRYLGPSCIMNDPCT